MMSSLTNLKAIASVQNVEQKQISDLTGTAFQVGSTNKNDTNLNSTSNDKISKNKRPEEEFNKLLNQVKKKKNDKNQKVVEDKKPLKVENKEKTKVKSEDIKDENIKEKLEDLTDEQLVQCLNLLVEFLNSTLKDDFEAINISQLNGLSDELKINLMEILNSNELLGALNDLQGSNSNVLQNSQDLFSNLLKLLNKTDAIEVVDVDTLKFAEKLLNEITSRLNKETVNNFTNNTALTEVVNETLNKLNEILNSNVKNNDELSLQNNSLNNVYKVIESTNSNETNNNSDSKDEKILESILKDSSEEMKMPVFTTTTTVMNNGAGAVVETKQTVNINTMAADVVKSVKYMAANDMREMIVKVNPGNLGEITIKLIEENGEMRLNMKAASRETYSLLVQQSSDIKNQLSDQNIKIQEVNISLYEEDTTFFKDGEFSRSFQEQSGNKGNGNTDKADLNMNDDVDSEDDNYDSSALDLLV